MRRRIKREREACGRAKAQEKEEEEKKEEEVHYCREAHGKEKKECS